MAEDEAEINVSSEEWEDEDGYEYNDYEDSLYNDCNREHSIPVLSDNYVQSVSQIRKKLETNSDEEQIEETTHQSNAFLKEAI
ncbi:hypothetical protein TNIN_190431 [Trichonephila inaurata madagascariensis]|uniref:Uncharacterized protein n=1 Tax=Trichonephila inaurata madagascariensis TaxID=2747483 RepID=A0A8X7C2M1_9ARAC|nr:hypothetical protein TNIN_190431 [Trichonephila inaurata madagascariensis]